MLVLSAFPLQMETLFSKSEYWLMLPVEAPQDSVYAPVALEEGPVMAPGVLGAVTSTLVPPLEALHPTLLQACTAYQ